MRRSLFTMGKRKWKRGPIFPILHGGAPLNSDEADLPLHHSEAFFTRLEDAHVLNADGGPEGVIAAEAVEPKVVQSIARHLPCR